MTLLSILIPSLPERLPLLGQLLASLPTNDPRLEVLSLVDNRRLKLGAKRNILTAAATGSYLLHLDDDDALEPGFLDTLATTLTGEDVVGFDADSSFNGGPPFRVTTSLHGPNTQPRPLGDNRYSDVTRTYWHWCAWRTDFARGFQFPEDKNWAEDGVWLERILPAVKTHRKVDAVLFHHRWSSTDTACGSAEK
jgi:hypothetical protein